MKRAKYSRVTAHNRRNTGAHQMKIEAAPLFLPRAGFVRSGAGNESFMSAVALSFSSGKNNGVVAQNVMRHCARGFGPSN